MHREQKQRFFFILFSVRGNPYQLVNSIFPLCGFEWHLASHSKLAYVEQYPIHNTIYEFYEFINVRTIYLTHTLCQFLSYLILNANARLPLEIYYYNGVYFYSSNRCLQKPPGTRHSDCSLTVNYCSLHMQIPAGDFEIDPCQSHFFLLVSTLFQWFIIDHYLNNPQLSWTMWFIKVISSNWFSMVSADIGFCCRNRRK